MKVTKVHARILLVGALAVLMLGGKAFAGGSTPEIDPGMAAGGLTLLGVGIVMLLERSRKN
ncbi:MAG TPA: hypothetical protein VN867_01750 [Candidatus Binataceae bacterium]|nr:hypothetical protein [Candidatus Binataceae bacterium]